MQSAYGSRRIVNGALDRCPRAHPRAHMETCSASGAQPVLLRHSRIPWIHSGAVSAVRTMEPSGRSNRSRRGSCRSLQPAGEAAEPCKHRSAAGQRRRTAARPASSRPRRTVNPSSTASAMISGTPMASAMTLCSSTCENETMTPSAPARARRSTGMTQEPSCRIQPLELPDGRSPARHAALLAQHEACVIGVVCERRRDVVSIVGVHDSYARHQAPSARASKRLAERYASTPRSSSIRG
jgi:hypothetical protein